MIQAGYGGAAPLTKVRRPVGASFGGAALYTPPTSTTGAPVSSLTGAIGRGGGGPLTTTTTVVPNVLENYEGQILADPTSQAAQGSFTTQAQGLANARAQAVRNAVFNAGWLPGQNARVSGALGSYASDLDPATIAAAQANPMSQKAQLDLQYSQAQQNTPYDLAARGAARSGALPIQMGNLSQQYDTASYQGVSDLLNSIYSAGNTYAGGYADAVNTLNAARAAVADRLARQAGYSQSVVTTGGDEGDGGDGGYLGEGVPQEPTPYGLAVGTPAVTQAPSMNQQVQRVINAIGGRKPANLSQIIRNVRYG